MLCSAIQTTFHSSTALSYHHDEHAAHSNSTEHGEGAVVAGNEIWVDFPFLRALGQVMSTRRPSMRRIMEHTPPVHLVEKPMMTPVAPMHPAMMTIPPMRPAMMTIPPMRPAMMTIPPMRPAMVQSLMVRRTAMRRTPWCAVGIALTVLRCVLSSHHVFQWWERAPFFWTEAVLGVAFFHKTSIQFSVHRGHGFLFRRMHMANGKSQPCQAQTQFPRSVDSHLFERVAVFFRKDHTHSHGSLGCSFLIQKLIFWCERKARVHPVIPFFFVFLSRHWFPHFLLGESPLFSRLQRPFGRRRLSGGGGNYASYEVALSCVSLHDCQ